MNRGHLRHALARGRLEHLGLPIPERFVSADDVAEGKPHPEAYLTGARILGVSPGSCLVVEDTPSGVRAARAAGMRVVALATTHPAEDLSEADVVASALTKLSVSRPKAGAGGGPRFVLSVSDGEEAQ